MYCSRMSIFGVLNTKNHSVESNFFADFEPIWLSKKYNIKFPFLGQKVEIQNFKILYALQKGRNIVRSFVKTPLFLHPSPHGGGCNLIYCNPVNYSNNSLEELYERACGCARAVRQKKFQENQIFSTFLQNKWVRARFPGVQPRVHSCNACQWIHAVWLPGCNRSSKTQKSR